MLTVACMVATCTVSLVSDAERFGLPDVEEGRFNLWLVGHLFPVAGGEPTAVDVWVLFLKLQTIKLMTFPSFPSSQHAS